MDDFSFSSDSFLSEAGAVKHFIPFSLSHWRGCPPTGGWVRCFFAYFFASRQKSKWGFRGKAPV